ncbi:hypothetical protein EX30DRAFT_230239 [Ascodesmis nigricans]|uniref:Uncharacterized protein n=1 Tax=Ascodesmis nigricans TaxID=341454 RepID=A0A4S2MIT5_9PEZI|nr:hypothetical protein EX30DRAFT_230239 [Ascodesmis nigricans]
MLNAGFMSTSGAVMVAVVYTVYRVELKLTRCHGVWRCDDDDGTRYNTIRYNTTKKQASVNAIAPLAALLRIAEVAEIEVAT